MSPPYGNQCYPNPPSPGYIGSPGVLPDLNQVVNQIGSITTSQAVIADKLVYFMQTIEAKNILTQAQKEQAIFDKEEAFSSIEETSRGLVMYGKNHHEHIVLPVRIKDVIYVQLDSLYRQESFYIIFFLNLEDPLIISEKDMRDPDYLLDALASATSFQVHIHGSQKKTAQQLRIYLTARAAKFPIPFFAGWTKKNSAWTYFLLNGKTHGNDDTHRAAAKLLSTEPPAPKENQSPSVTLTMLNQIIRFMNCVTNSELSGLLFTWIHAASICSLLQVEGFPISMGLCLYSSDPRVVKGLEVLMCWYGDKPISTNLPPAEFRYQIIARKDQPMAITDSTTANKNTDCLLTAMDTSQIPADRGQVPQKIQALPTVISNTLGPLCYSPQFILVEVTASDLLPTSLAKFSNLRKYLPDYLRAFATYTQEHIAELTDIVETETYTAHSRCPVDCPMSSDSLSTQGVLNGVQKFIWEFHKDLAPDEELQDMLHALSPQKPSELLKDTLMKSAAYVDTSTAIASQYCAIATRWITDGSLELYNLQRKRMNRPKSKTHGIVYRDPEHHYFTRFAFSEICKATGNTAPIVLSALWDTGVLAGPQTNSSTYQTRKNIAGKSTALYKLDSTAMDEHSKIEG